MDPHHKNSLATQDGVLDGTANNDGVPTSMAVRGDAALLPTPQLFVNTQHWYLCECTPTGWACLVCLDSGTTINLVTDQLVSELGLPVREGPPDLDLQIIGEAVVMPIGEVTPNLSQSLTTTMYSFHHCQWCQHFRCHGDCPVHGYTLPSFFVGDGSPSPFSL